MSDLALGVGIAAAVGVLIACCVVLYYKYVFTTGDVGRSTEELQRRLGTEKFVNGSRFPRQKEDWIDSSNYNGVAESEIVIQPTNDRRSRRTSRRSVQLVKSSSKEKQGQISFHDLEVGVPSLPKKPSTARDELDGEESEQFLPTDMRTTRRSFRAALETYYLKFAPHMGPEDIDTMMEAYADDPKGRADLDRQLQEQNGQGLDQLFVAQKEGNDDVPAPKRRDQIPSVRIVGGPSAEKLEDVLKRLKLESSLNTLRENGIRTLEDASSIDEDLIPVLFPRQGDHAQARILIEQARAANV